MVGKQTKYSNEGMYIVVQHRSNLSPTCSAFAEIYYMILTIN